MKVYISLQLSQNSFGGGNNFLRYLGKYLKKKELLVGKAKFADVIVINSHHRIIHNLFLKIIYPEKLFVHRIDGKLSAHRDIKYWDDLVKLQNKYLANFTIFQSNWSRDIWRNELKPINSIVIHNSANPELFYSNKENSKSNRIKLIFVSWSNNPNKGREYLEWIIGEKNKLNIDLQIIGNLSLASSINSKLLVNQAQVADLYRESNIFFFPSKNEACSNALIEAQACGLPILALHSGGNPELVLDSGETFNNTSELKIGLNKIVREYDRYRENALKISNSRKAPEEYEEFLESIFANNKVSSKHNRINLIFAAILILKSIIQIKIAKLK
jgi:glycosyltransferase involved in cell wall biosynthesis